MMIAFKGLGSSFRASGFGFRERVSTGSYLRLIDSCITQLKAQGPSRTCNESKEEEEYLLGQSTP